VLSNGTVEREREVEVDFNTGETKTRGKISRFDNPGNKKFPPTKGRSRSGVQKGGERNQIWAPPNDAHVGSVEPSSKSILEGPLVRFGSIRRWRCPRYGWEYVWSIHWIVDLIHKSKLNGSQGPALKSRLIGTKE